MVDVASAIRVMRSSSQSTTYNDSWIGQGGTVLGLHGHLSSQKCTSSYWATLKAGDSEENITALSLRLRQPSGSNQGFLNAHVSLCCFVVGFVYRGWGRTFEHVL